MRISSTSSEFFYIVIHLPGAWFFFDVRKLFWSEPWRKYQQLGICGFISIRCVTDVSYVAVLMLTAFKSHLQECMELWVSWWLLNGHSELVFVSPSLRHAGKIREMLWVKTKGRQIQSTFHSNNLGLKNVPRVNMPRAYIWVYDWRQKRRVVNRSAIFETLNSRHSVICVCLQRISWNTWLFYCSNLENNSSYWVVGVKSMQIINIVHSGNVSDIVDF